MDGPESCGDIPVVVGRQFYVFFNVNYTLRQFHGNRVFGVELYENQVFWNQLEAQAATSRPYLLQLREAWPRGPAPVVSISWVFHSF